MRDHFPSLSLSPTSFLPATAVVSAVAFSAYLYIRPALARSPADTGPPKPARSPRWIITPEQEPARRDTLPYPPDVLPGARDVDTPYGSLRVYEWGDEQGEKVLLLHGISTPCLALGEMAKTLADKGHRVMLFDFFGRGFSDAPTDLPYDSRLFTAQIHLALSSSPLPWSGTSAFHLVGYSLGGAVAASFSRYHPHLVRSLTLIATGGLVRPHHVSWKSRLLYSEGVFPERLLQGMIRQRLWPAERVPDQPEAEVVSDARGDTEEGREDGEEGPRASSFNNAILVKGRPDLRVAGVVARQLRTHPGFVAAYKSTIRHAPIYDQGDKEWAPLKAILAARRGSQGSTAAAGAPAPGLLGGKVLFLLAETDPVVVAAETEEDAKRALGDEAVEVRIFKGVGHELGITHGPELADEAVAFWKTMAEY